MLSSHRTNNIEGNREAFQEGSHVAEKPEELARVEIDKLLAAAGWAVQPAKEANIQAE